MHTAGKKNLSTGIRFKQVILKGFLRLDLQPVQLIWQNNPPAFTTILLSIYLEKSKI